jgi:hypothetical protein
VFLEPPGILESPFQVGLGLVTLRFAPEVVVGAAEADQRLGVRGIEVENLFEGRCRRRRLEGRGVVPGALEPRGHRVVGARHRELQEEQPVERFHAQA